MVFLTWEFLANEKYEENSAEVTFSLDRHHELEYELELLKLYHGWGFHLMISLDIIFKSSSVTSF